MLCGLVVHGGRIRVHRNRLLQAVILVSLLFPFSSLCAFAQSVPENIYQGIHWRMIGPFRGGRTRAVAGVPSQPNVFYFGAVNGGVWKSDDYGRTWNPIFDSQSTQSIGAIAVAPSDSNIVYVASGEGLHRPDLSVGDGIYKSTDAGKTWAHLGLQESAQIPAIAIDPHDPNRLFAAVLGRPYGPSEQRGIFRSMDGGVTWQRVLYKDENTGGSDIEMDPLNPDIIYASLWEVREGPWEDNNIFQGNGGGLFKSTDGGNTWKQLKDGLPANLAQINVAIAPSMPSRLYAAFATTEKTGYATGKGLGFYRSDDGGEHWYSPSKDARPSFKIGGGDLPIPRVDPKNPDVVYSASLVTMRSTDGGRTWTGIRGAPGGDDYQNLWINPENPNIILLVADQGAIVTVNGGATWSSWYNQPTAQLYHASVSHTFPYRVCSGQQESGSVCTLSRGNDGEITFRDWHPVGAIEYGYVAPDPIDPDIIYGAGRTEVSKYDWSTGQVQNITPVPVRNGEYRADRTQPIMFSPINPHVLYYAANVLFKTTDGGQHWEKISKDLSREDAGSPPSVGNFISKNPDSAKQRGTIYSLAPSHQDINTIWAGTDDGLIWITRDGGKNWQNISPKDMTPWRKVTQMEASHFDAQSAYASASGFRIDDMHPYIYRTHDGGKSWQLITNGLPDNSPVDTVREDPMRKGLLFCGTENAVWVSFDDGDHWQSLQLNLPHTSMRDLWIYQNDLILATHGRSFWILDDITPLRQASAEMMNSAATLFRPAEAYRVRRDTNTDTPLPPDEPAGENPPDGAIIDYYLPKAASGPLTIEILDAQGKVVRRYASDEKPEVTMAMLEKQVIPLYWLRMPTNPETSAGMHRWTWDLHCTTPIATEHGYPIAAVPHDTPREPLGTLAMPGEYSVRLNVDGKSYMAPLAVRMDPRVKTPVSGLQEQFMFASRLSSQLSQSSEAVLEAESMRDQLKSLPAQNGSQIQGAIQSFTAKITNLLEGEKDSKSKAPTLRSINEKSGTLYGEIEQADVAPTAAQIAAATAVDSDFATVMKSWNQWKTTELSDLNRQLKVANLPEVKVEMKQPDDTGGMDLD
jgi:photosystem II stability/assembly factor-like uncharacterized protein